MNKMAAEGWHIASAGKKHQVWEREVVDDVQEDDHSADENNPSRMDLEDSVPFDELKPGEIYEGYPKDSSGICERVIFCPKTIFHKDELVITRFSVYEEYDGGVHRYKCTYMTLLPKPSALVRLTDVLVRSINSLARISVLCLAISSNSRIEVFWMICYIVLAFASQRKAMCL